MAYKEKPTNVYPPNPLSDTFIKGPEIDRQIRQSINASNDLPTLVGTHPESVFIIRLDLTRGILPLDSFCFV